MLLKAKQRDPQRLCLIWLALQSQALRALRTAPVTGAAVTRAVTPRQ
jgi:hypothetical protein